VHAALAAMTQQPVAVGPGRVSHDCSSDAFMTCLRYIDVHVIRVVLGGDPATANPWPTPRG
jgi:hypothetical protein